MAWVWKFMATRAASGWLVAAIIAIVAAGGVYVQNLRLQVAKCQATNDMLERNERLADRIEEGIRAKENNRVDDIEGGSHPCLDMRVDELLGDKDSLEASRVR